METNDMSRRTGRSVRHAMATLESLKLGVVPDEALESLSVGCEDLMALVSEDLAQAAAPDPGGAFRLVLGEYGHGKSHLLDRVEKQALEQGFLVARTAFGTREASPHSPVELYRALMSGLKYPGGDEVGLVRLLGEAAGNPEVFEQWTGLDRESLEGTGGAAQHVWFTPGILGQRLLTRASQRRDTERLLAWLSGQPGPPALLQKRLRRAARRAGMRRRHGTPNPLVCRGIPRWRSVPQIACYLLGGISSLAHDLGYAGLILLLDEGEHFQWLKARDEEHAINLALGLQAAALPSHPDSGLHRGGTRKHRQVPYRFRPVQHIGCFVALAPQSDSSRAMAALEGVPGDRRIELAQLSAEHLQELAGRVLDLAIVAGLDGPHLPASRMYLNGYIDNQCSAGRSLPPRQVVKLAATLPDVLRGASSLPTDPIESWVRGRTPGR